MGKGVVAERLHAFGQDDVEQGFAGVVGIAEDVSDSGRESHFEQVVASAEGHATYRLKSIRENDFVEVSASEEGDVARVAQSAWGDEMAEIGAIAESRVGQRFQVGVSHVDGAQKPLLEHLSECGEVVCVHLTTEADMAGEKLLVRGEMVGECAGFIETDVGVGRMVVGVGHLDKHPLLFAISTQVIEPIITIAVTSPTHVDVHLVALASVEEEEVAALLA